MATSAFSLAGISLFAAPDYAMGVGGFEVPQELETGLETWGSLHKLPQTGVGTAKIITQTFGVFPLPITWTARFLGTNAKQRYSTFAAAHGAQQVVPFICGSERWDVVIWKLSKKELSRYDIEYTIVINPLAERSGHVTTSFTSLPASTALSNHYTNMTGLVGSAP